MIPLVQKIKTRFSKIKTLCLAIQEAKYLHLTPPASLRYTEPRRCLIYTSFALHYPHVRSELLFAHALLEAGWEVKLVFCAGLYDSCEFSKARSNKIGFVGSNCKSCCSLFSSLAKANPSFFISLADINLPAAQTALLESTIDQLLSLQPADLIDYSVEGVQIHEHVLSTLCRQELKSPPSLEDIPPEKYRKIAINVAKSIVVSKFLIGNYLPNLILCTHGVYLNHGPLVSLAKKMGVSTTVWGVPYRKGTYYMTKTDTYHRALIGVPSSLWNTPLTQYETSLVERYLQSKESGGRDYWHYAGSNKSSVADAIQAASERSKVYALFTNVDWDAQIFYGGMIFANQLDWIRYTLLVIKDLPSVTLCIRIHPADADYLKSSSPFTEQVNEAITESGSINVILIPANDSFSSYELICISDLCLIYGSKISLECAYREKPTVITGNSLFRQSEFSYLPLDCFAYKQLLICPPKLTPRQKEMALRFAYYLYYRVFRDCEWADNLFDSYTGFRSISDEGRMKLVDSIIYGTNV